MAKASKPKQGTTGKPKRSRPSTRPQTAPVPKNATVDELHQVEQAWQRGESVATESK